MVLAYDDEPDELYGSDSHDPVYDDTSTGSQIGAYLDGTDTYTGEADDAYSTGAIPAPNPASGPAYSGTNTPYAADTMAAVTTYDADDLRADYEDTVAERMAQYGLDPEDGWAPLLEPGAYDASTDIDVMLDNVATEIEEAYGDIVDEQQYVTAVEEAVDTDDVGLYGRYLEDSVDETPYMEIAVVEQEMPDGLFGFTRPSGEKIAFVNKALYKIDKERTALHEITHQEKPHWSEFMVRSRRTRGGGDIDPQHTLSYQANNVGRIGNGSGRRRPYNA